MWCTWMEVECDGSLTNPSPRDIWIKPHKANCIIYVSYLRHHNYSVVFLGSILVQHSLRVGEMHFHLSVGVALAYAITVR